MEYKDAQNAVALKIYTIKAIIEHGYNNGEDNMESMDNILMQIGKQVTEGRELIKKQSYHERISQECC